ncbi:plasmid replication protein RepC [Polystyrenella longa]|nr:plasmid replication protein RepC [Polystyrenella longa]
MQHISTQTIPFTLSQGGGRIASDRYRHSLAQCDHFRGLAEGTSRYDLLLLVKKVGKLAGFSPRMIQLLDYYMAYTREIDWEEGSRPIVYQSLSRTALDMGVSERQIQKLEQQLFTVGAITWNDSGNHRRFGQRDRTTGRIVYAYGIDLTPLAFLREELEQKLHEKQLRDQAWLETKRQISACRRQIRSLLAEWSLEEGASEHELHAFNARYETIAVQLRTYLDLETLRSLLLRHQSLHEEIMTAMGVGAEDTNPAQETSAEKIASKGSSQNVSKFAHYNYSTQLINNCSPEDLGFQKSEGEPSSPQDIISATGLQHISLSQVLGTASDRFKAYLPLKAGAMDWQDVTEAAYRVREDLSISQQSWGEACELLGRTGAALCVLLTDQANKRSVNPVTKPAGYFRSLINKGRAGELRLHNSIFGLLEQHER